MTNQIWIYYGKIENLVKEEGLKEDLKRERERKAGRLLLLKAVNESRFPKSRYIQNLEELEQSIEIGTHGKPYFKDKTRFPFFNISHSGDYAVCALATCEIGIDIQKIRPYSPRLLKRILTRQELEQLEQTKEKEALFCKLWSQKESYVKWSGQGITRELNTLEKNAWQESFSIQDYWVCVTARSACKIECIKETE